jgi:hypothetical protein
MSRRVCVYLSWDRQAETGSPLGVLNNRFPALYELRLHHGDIVLPGQQRTGGFALSLMARLGAPVRNRFGLRPAATAAAKPLPFQAAADDRHGLLRDVPYLNLHPHLPDFERIGAAEAALEVLVRQVVSTDAPAHPALPPGVFSTASCRPAQRRTSDGLSSATRLSGLRPTGASTASRSSGGTSVLPE